MGRQVHSTDCIARPRGGDPEGRAVAGAIRQGNLYLHRVRILPAAACRCSRGRALVCEFAQRGTEDQPVDDTSLVVGKCLKSLPLCTCAEVVMHLPLKSVSDSSD